MNNLQLSRFTPDNRLNFVGAVNKYFQQYTENCNSETKDAYVQRYRNHIFPYINLAIPVSEYSEEVIENLISTITEKGKYSEDSVNTDLRHLIYSPCTCYFEVPQNIDTDLLWGSSYRFRHSGDEDIDETELRIRKSLSVDEEIRAAELLSDYESDDGAMMGLALMFYSGTRNNEACGLNFADEQEMVDYPGCYYMQVYETVKLDSNSLKPGGKSYNAPRRLPVVPALHVLLQKRKEYILSKLQFPFKSPDGETFDSVDDFPIVCKKNEYWNRAKSKDLTNAGREFLRGKLKISEQEVSGISYIINRDARTADDLKEKDPTTYLLRRNMATRTYIAGFSTSESQYYMGHVIENTALRRSDFADEQFLHGLYVKLCSHPISGEAKKNSQHEFNGQYFNVKNTTGIKLDIHAEKKESALVTVSNCEQGDTITVRISDNENPLEVTKKRLNDPIDTGVNIIKQVAERYDCADLCAGWADDSDPSDGLEWGKPVGQEKILW